MSHFDMDAWIAGTVNFGSPGTVNGNFNIGYGNPRMHFGDVGASTGITFSASGTQRFAMMFVDKGGGVFTTVVNNRDNNGTVQLRACGSSGGTQETTVLEAFYNGIDIKQELGFGALSPTQLTADVDDYDPWGSGIKKVRLRMSANASGPWTVSGFEAPVLSNSMLIVTNIGANAFDISNNDSGSVSANRVLTGTGAAITLAQYQSKMFIYDDTLAKWMAI